MKYAANQRRISSFVRIVNFVRQVKGQRPDLPHGSYMKELKINTPLGCAFSTHLLSKLLILWANSGQNPDRPHGRSFDITGMAGAWSFSSATTKNETP